MTIKYRGLRPLTKEGFLEILVSGETLDVCHAIAEVVHSLNDHAWLLEQFRFLLKHPSLEVRKVTITSFGHLARLNSDVDKFELLQTLQPLLADPELVGRVEDAIEDIETFL